MHTPMAREWRKTEDVHVKSHLCSCRLPNNNVGYLPPSLESNDFETRKTNTSKVSQWFTQISILH